MDSGIQLATLLVALPFAAAVTVTVPVFREVAGLFSAVMIAIQGLVLIYAWRVLSSPVEDIPFFDTIKPSLFTNISWIEMWGVNYHMVLDYPALGLAALTLLVTGAATMYSWFVDRERLYLVHSLFWITAAALNGVYMARDLVLWYTFFEVMLIPMVFMIGIWGGKEKIKAAATLMVYTLVGSLFMLIGIMGIGATTGTFDMIAISQMVNETPGLLPTWSFWMVLFAMAVKAPLFPLHGWLPLAYREAPIEGSAVLSGLVSKAAMVGLMVIIVPFFPVQLADWDQWLVAIAVFSLLYGSISAFRQQTFRSVIAYSSIAQMGLVLLGIFVALSAGGNEGLAGAYLQTINHGIVSAALFLLAGLIERRTGTEELTAMRGVAENRPRLATVGIVLVLITLAVPGSSVFASELMILLGAWQFSQWAGAIGSLAIVLAAMYALRAGSAVLHTDDDSTDVSVGEYGDATAQELAIVAPLVVVLVILSIKPAIMEQPMNERMVELPRTAFAASTDSPPDSVESTPTDTVGDGSPEAAEGDGS